MQIPERPTALRPGEVATLRRLTRPPPKADIPEQCELCSVPLMAEHRHLLEAATGRITCACDACALLFEQTTGGHFKLIPRDARLLADFQLKEMEWESLALPINLVFIFQNSRTGKLTAMYPSPGGATESLLSLENWSGIVANNPALAQLQPDVEALLVNRVGEAHDHFIAPIDVCYKLVGIIRSQWRGFSGGDAVWGQINSFFAMLKESALVLKNSEGGHD